MATTSGKTTKWQGSKWIRPEKRLAIYLRDGLSCCWCGASVEDGVQMNLDHLQPRSKGGGNAESNLVTSCERCNKSRGNRSAKAFAAAVAGYVNHGVTAADILGHIRDCTRRPLPLDEAKELIGRRGTAAKVLASL